MSVVPDWDASCVRVWVSRALFLLYSSVQVCVCRLEGPFRVCPSVPGWGCQSMCALWCCWRSSCGVGCAFPLPPFLLCYSPCVLWFLRCLLGLWWSYPSPFPLSLIVVVWCLLSLGSRLLVRRVFQWPPWSSRIPPPVTVGVGTWECVVCDLALWYWQRSWLPLSSGVLAMCVSLRFCAVLSCVSRLELVFFPDHLPFLLPLVSLVCSAQWGGAGHL